MGPVLFPFSSSPTLFDFGKMLVCFTLVSALKGLSTSTSVCLKAFSATSVIKLGQVNAPLALAAAAEIAKSFATKKKGGTSTLQISLTCRNDVEDARHDLPADEVAGAAEHRAVVHLRLGHVREEAGRALVGEGVPREVHAAARRVEGPREDVRLREGVHAA